MERVFKLVVVEDSETQAFRLRMLLEEQGWEVSIAGAAEAALAMLEDALPDLILCDYNLPGMNGDEFCRRIRKNLNTRGIPILMITAAAPETAEIQCLESGADGYISKSESIEILIARIRALLREAPAQPAIRSPHDSAIGNGRILAIDDSATYREFLAEQLRDQGYLVDTAASGLEGLTRLVNEEFDCVLVDLEMPEMDGVEVCRRIAAIQGLNSGVPVIVVTAGEELVYLNRALEAGADDFVNKSNDSAVLRARVEALLRRRLFLHQRNQTMAEEFQSSQLEVSAEHAGKRIPGVRPTMAGELTGIAHQIDHPLASVVSNLSAVESGLEALTPELESSLSEPCLLKLRNARARLEEMREDLHRVQELVGHLQSSGQEGELPRVLSAPLIAT
jgi:DNA-binding response OmpR family regulator